jgi:hypothetical protein
LKDFENKKKTRFTAAGVSVSYPRVATFPSGVLAGETGCFIFGGVIMFQPAKLSSLLDISDELRRDVCQLMFLHETIPLLFMQEVDQEVIDGMSSCIFHVLGSLNTIEDRLKQINRATDQVEAQKY